MNIWKPRKVSYAKFVKNKSNGISDVATLYELLTYIRIAKSQSESEFVEQLITILPSNTTQDRYGNILVTVGDNPASVLFSCHVDMISADYNASRQTLMLNEAGYLCCANPSQLGADDGAGIWIMLNMIAANIAGLYIFHRDEEIGGLGSLHIQHYETEILDGIKNAIAFDRRGTNSIVTHMLYQRCCSNGYAQALSKALGMAHELDDAGGFTDVSQYIGLIAECTNISVGYINEHTTTEQLNHVYLVKLRDKLLKINWQELSKPNTKTFFSGLICRLADK